MVIASAVVIARTVNPDVEEACGVMGRLAPVDVDMYDVGLILGDRDVAPFRESFEEVLAALGAKALRLSGH